VRRFIFFAFLSLILAGCAYKPPFTIDYDKLPPDIRAYWPVEKALSARLWALSKHGLPILAGDAHSSRTVFEVEDLFIPSYPPDEETWKYLYFQYTFYSLAKLDDFSYTAPQYPPGALNVSIQDTCTKLNDSTNKEEFIIEFFIDGLKEEGRTTLYKIQILIKGKEKWEYLYDTSPILGQTGLRAVKLTAFVEREILEDIAWKDVHSKKRTKKSPVLIIVWDFRSREKREAVFELTLSR
jgi:hypothetical protein